MEIEDCLKTNRHSGVKKLFLVVRRGAIIKKSELKTIFDVFYEKIRVFLQIVTNF